MTLEARAASAGVPVTPEMALLLCCARRRIPEGDRERLRQLSTAIPDWRRVIRMASWHGLLPLLHKHLDGIEGVPESAQAFLRGHFLNSAEAGLRLSAQMLELLHYFEDHGVPAVPYKGPALAAQLYGNVALRQSVDLDLLVHREHVGIARALLRAQGYRPRHELTEVGQAFRMRTRYAEMFDREGRLPVELHWAFTNGDVAFPLTLADLAPRLRRGRLGSASIPVLSDEDLLLILCVHGAKHRWDRLEWVCGVAELIRSAPQLNWAEVRAAAEESGSRRMLLLGISSAQELLAAPVPAAVLHQARADRRIDQLADEVWRLLCESRPHLESAEEFGSIRHDLFHLRLRERRRDQLQYLFYRLTTPSRPESWRPVSAGGRTIAMHAIIRPLRVAAKLAQAGWLYFRRRRQGLRS
ncbi:MAG: nucleotidyltransferase domain-containing protein [Gemmatimonadales bacterium]